MKICLVAIGDEVLNGQVVNTNASWLAERLSSRGYYVAQMQVIADKEAEIYTMIVTSFQEFDLTIITGGLGPTKDDITKKVFANYFQCGYKTDETTEKKVIAYFAQRGLELLEINKQQAFVPEVATVLPNDYGTAPGMLYEKNKRIVISLPGVPFEMKGIMNDHGFAWIQDYFQAEEYYSKTVLTTGIGESFLAAKIADWEECLHNDELALAYLPSLGQVNLRLTSMHQTPKEIQKVNAYLHELQQLIPEYLYGEEGDTLSKVVGRLLKTNNLTIATMESCTAGGIANELAKTSGASSYIKGGLITYTNEIKQKIGEISETILINHTELSAECAEAMAKNAARQFSADIGLGITGLLEVEEGETFAYIAIHYKGETLVKREIFGKSRAYNIQMSIFASLNLLRNLLLKE